MQSKPRMPLTGRFATIAGILGLVGTGLLIAALFAPTPSPNSMRRETDFFLWQDAFVIAQAVAMLPVTLGLYRLTTRTAAAAGTLAVGLFAQAYLVVTTALIFTNTAADMLYMFGIGLVGIWLFLVNRRALGLTSSKVMWTGRVAGFGCVLIGLGFLIYGLLVAPAVFVRPLTVPEIDAQTLTPANLISHLCLAAGTVLGRVFYPTWSLLLGRALLLRSNNQPGGVAIATG